MTYVIAEPCVDIKDRSCMEQCPVDCIYEGARALYINPEECIECGACEPACPTEAIYYEADLPPEYEPAALSNLDLCRRRLRVQGTLGLPRRGTLRVAGFRSGESFRRAIRRGLFDRTTFCS